MKLYRLRTVQFLPIPIEEAWTFFSNPANLGRITPPWMRFEITSPLPERVYAGLIVTYRIRPVLGFPVDWITEITQVRTPHFFVDEQRFGPYRFWHHEHHFRETDGGVEVEDLVLYAMPYGWLGTLIQRLVVARRLEEIFDYRRRTLETLFKREVRHDR